MGARQCANCGARITTVHQCAPMPVQPIDNISIRPIGIVGRALMSDKRDAARQRKREYMREYMRQRRLKTPLPSEKQA